jgi:hypothetical protein
MKKQVEKMKLTIQQDIDRLIKEKYKLLGGEDEKEKVINFEKEKVINLRIDTLTQVLVIIDDLDGTNLIGKWGYFWDDDDDLLEKNVFAYSKLIGINFNDTPNTFEASNGFYDHFSLTPPITN